MADVHLIGVEPLRAAMRALVSACGSREAEAAAVADNLIDANLAGHDSHGIGMLPRYVASLHEGGLRVNEHVRTVLDAGALLRLDGNAGFGQVVGAEAMALGIERARAHGCAIVALGNAHHLGRIGAWAEMAVAAGFVSLHFVNVISRPIVAPYGGATAGDLGGHPRVGAVEVAASQEHRLPERREGHLPRRGDVGHDRVDVPRPAQRRQPPLGVGELLEFVGEPQPFRCDGGEEIHGADATGATPASLGMVLRCPAPPNHPRRSPWSPSSAA